MTAQWYTIREAAEILGCHRETLRLACVRGDQPGAVRTSVGWRIARHAVDAPQADPQVEALLAAMAPLVELLPCTGEGGEGCSCARCQAWRLLIVRKSTQIDAIVRNSA